MLRFKQLILPLLMFACIGAACSSDEEGIISPAEEYEVCLRVSQPATRTAMGEASDTEQTIKWSKGDKFLLWAYPEGSQNAAIDAATFTQYVYSTDSYSTSDFTATLNAPMSKGTYNYYAAYPIPENRDETKVTYTLPATQTGVYDPNLDVMVASTRGNALLARTTTSTEITWEEPTMSFSHLFHLIRIRIPEGKNNLGLPIKRLEITFPQEVVGTVTFDVKDPTETAQWTNLSNKITVDLADGNEIDAGDGYVWLYVKPGTLNGTISFKAYDVLGVPRAAISKSFTGKTFVANHITPIALTIPQPAKDVYYLNLTQTASYLGENIQTLTISGVNFIDPVACDGSTTTNPQSFVYGKEMLVAVYTDAVSGGTQLTTSYESEHALLQNRTIALPTSLTANTKNNVPYTVPYLFEENFNSATANSDNTNEETGVSLSSVGLTDWSASKWATTNSTLQLSIYIGTTAAGGTDVKFGRTDTPSMTNLKSGITTKLKISFDLGLTENVKSGIFGYNIQSKGYFGTSLYDNSNPYPNGGSVEVAGSGGANLPTNQVAEITDCIMGSGYDASKMKNYSYTISDCNATTRFTWVNHYLNHKGAPAGQRLYLYLDNIKVSISK